MNRAAFAACRLLFRLALIPAPAEFRQTYASRMFDILTENVTEASRRGGRLAGSIACVRGCLDGLWASLVERGEATARHMRHAARSLLRAPLATFVSVGAIALAIGANLVVADVLEGVLLRPLPFADPQRLLFVQESDFGHAMSYPDARGLADRVNAFAELAVADFDSRTLFGQGQSSVLSGSLVSPNYFGLLGLHPSLGRFFSSGDLGQTVVVISDGLWRERFARDPNVIGRRLLLNDRDYSIVGVAPASFRDPTPYGAVERAYWIPVDPRNSRLAGSTEFNFNGIARVRPGFASAAGADNIGATLRSLIRERRGAHPKVCCARVSTVMDAIVGPVRPLLWSLFALVGLVLLIACANVANLQFARNAAREGEFAVRTALGASPGRLAAELTTETVLVVVAGALLGLSLVPLGLAAFAELGARILPRWENVGIDRSLFVYALGLVVVVTFLAGLLPVLFARRDVAGRIATSHSTDRRSMKRLRAGLVVAEIALATTLVISASLVTRSEIAFTHVELGFKPQETYVMRANPAPPRYKSDAAVLRFVRSATARLSAIPGVASVSASSGIPLVCCDSQGVTLPHRPEASILYTSVTPGYFRTLGIPLVRGRFLHSSDGPNSPCVALVDTTFARRYFGRSTAVGQVVKTSGSNPNCTIVGVVGAVREGFGLALEPMLYLALSQDADLNYFVIRTDGGNVQLGNEVVRAFANVDPTFPVSPLSSYGSIVAENTLHVRANMALFGALAGIALVLAFSGVFAVTAFSVEKRTQEFGIRKALGAPTGAVVRDVIGAALAQCGAGVALGILLSALLAGFLKSLLYEISPFDPVTILAVAGLFAICAVIAALAPALHATRVEPAVALGRHEDICFS